MKYLMLNIAQQSQATIEGKRLLKGETVEAVETWTTKKNLQKPVPRAAAAYGRQLKIPHMSISKKNKSFVQSS